ncbi:hypothetical protein ABZP36_006276 [Zizania latifolia]
MATSTPPPPSILLHITLALLRSTTMPDALLSSSTSPSKVLLSLCSSHIPCSSIVSRYPLQGQRHSGALQNGRVTDIPLDLACAAAAIVERELPHGDHHRRRHPRRVRAPGELLRVRDQVPAAPPAVVPKPAVARGAAGRVGAVGDPDRGLGLPFIRMLPVVRFTAAACGEDAGVAPRISVSECAVCLSEFVERERVRLLPNCSHAFHNDCIDTWLQGNARCPFCRSDVTLSFTPAASARLTSTRAAPSHRASSSDDDDDEDADVDRVRRHRPPDELITMANSIVIEVRGDHESWFSHGASPADGNGRRISRIKPQRHKPAESLGDEAIDTRKKYEEFAVQPMRRSLSMDSCVKQLYVSVQEEFLALSQV